MIIEIGHVAIVPHLALTDNCRDNQISSVSSAALVFKVIRRENLVVAALCFGSVFGFPFIIMGIIFVVDRDRSWQRQLQRGHSDTLPRRTRAWDRRQIAYGALLMLFGAIILILLTTFNFLAQGISPATPF